MSIAFGKRASSQKPSQPQPEINITPLVDVVLVLLIIFMVIAPQLENGERVELPGVTAADAPDKNSMDPITVTVAASGNLFLEKEPVLGTQLESKLSALRKQDPSRKIVIKGDGSVGYEHVRELLSSIERAGFPGAGLQVGDGRSDSTQLAAVAEGER